MEDRELLELAAKAAGIDVRGYDKKYGIYLEWDDPKEKAYWNPLEDDGDALRLAVGLGLQLDCENCMAQIDSGTWYDASEVEDDYFSMRIAIVRAAAEIGNSLTTDNRSA